MSWIMTTGARKIRGMTPETKLKAVFGGASASKTYSIIPVLIDRAIKNDGEIITIVSDTSRTVRDGAARDFESIMKDLGRWSRNRWTKNPFVYRFANGSVIEFLGADEPDKFRGPRRDRLYVNEANRLTWETFVQMNTRTRKETWLDWNPTAPFWYEEHIKGKKPHEWLRLTYLDNESLSDKEIAEFEYAKKMSDAGDLYYENWWRVYGLGLTGQTEGACIKSFKTCSFDGELFTDKEGNLMDGYQLVGIGLDFGDNDPNAAVALYKNENSFIFDEILYKNKLEIKDIYKVLKPYDTYVYADYNFPQTIRTLQNTFNMGNIFKCKKGPDSIKKGLNLINELDVYVTDSSENLIHEFLSYRYKQDKDGHFLDNKFEGPDHLVDACRYVLTRNINKRQFRVL